MMLITTQPSILRNSVHVRQLAHDLRPMPTPQLCNCNILYTKDADCCCLFKNTHDSSWSSVWNEKWVTTQHSQLQTTFQRMLSAYLSVTTVCSWTSCSMPFWQLHCTSFLLQLVSFSPQHILFSLSFRPCSTSISKMPTSRNSLFILSFGTDNFF